MTDQEINARIGVIERQLGGREQILIELRARAFDDPSALRLISLVEQWDESRYEECYQVASLEAGSCSG